MPRSETSELRRIWRLVFHALGRRIEVGALGDIHAPAIPIRWPGSFDVRRSGPTDRPGSTCARYILDPWAGLLSSLRLCMPHNERRYAKEDRSSQRDCQ